MDFDDGDFSHYKPADWAELSKLKNAYKEGGATALKRAMTELEKDPIRWSSVMAAFIGDEISESIKDMMADRGMTREDLQDLIRKLEGSEKKH